MKTAEDILKAKAREPICIAPEATLQEALETMLAEKIGAILVEEGGRIIGIWTERDLLRDTLQGSFDPKTARIRDHMTRSLRSAPHTDTIYRLLDKFLGMRIRHLLIEKDREYIGIVSQGDVVAATLREKNRELAELRDLVTWEYYENWGWKKEP
ncbi:MAG: CBS domain-containing protein [Planctomycetes bacterium]|nr:CBS domain-containing protein [Planctomycetota bacterium]